MKMAAKHVAKAYVPLQVRDFGYGEVALASPTGKKTGLVKTNSHFFWNNGGKTINHPFGIGLYHLFLVIWGVVYVCFTIMNPYPLVIQKEQEPNSKNSVPPC